MLNPYDILDYTKFMNAFMYVLQHVPVGFARSNGFFNMNNSEMVVMDEKQRFWPTKVCPTHNRVRIRGFKDIFTANGLKAGDEFVLELVDNGKKPLMNLKCNLFLPISLSLCCLKHATVLQLVLSCHDISEWI